MINKTSKEDASMIFHTSSEILNLYISYTRRLSCEYKVKNIDL
jgi:hypothetical protein